MNRLVLLSVLLPPLLAAGCSRGVDQPSAASLDGNGQAEMQRSLDEMTLAVRLKAAEARIVELERHVGALEASPQRLENQLLVQRIEQLEARTYARAPDGDPATPAPRATARAAEEPAPTPTPTPAAGRFNPFGL